jgi:sporulation protein YlmC with PRC-barrel domain
MLKRSVAALAAVALAVPALAQTPPAASHNKSSAAVAAPATHDAGSNPTAGGYNTPSARNPVLTDHGSLRTSKIVGSAVYNDRDEKIGSVDDIVVDKDKTVQAILSVGGFLGIGNKLVQVPFDKLQFGNTKESSDNRVVLPGATKDSLKSMAEYRYTSRA